MTTSIKHFSKTKVSSVNRIMYALFVMFGVYNLVNRQDTLEAMSMFGLALIFDPFNQETEWKKRPAYQKVWLIVHVAFVIALLVIGLTLKQA